MPRLRSLTLAVAICLALAAASAVLWDRKALSVEANAMENPVLAPLSEVEVRALFQLRQELVIKKKDPQAYVPVARTLLMYLTAEAQRLSPATALYKRTAKVVAYNLAADLWPGFNEGIEIGDETLKLGMAAAELNLQLTEDLELPAIARSRGHFIIGAHHVASRDFAAAKHHFESAYRLALPAEENRAEALGMKGYAALTDLLASPGNPGASQELDAIKKELASVEQGQFFIEQIDTAHRIFSEN